MAISEKVRARIRSRTAAMRCGEDGVSLIQTAEGAMASVHTMLQRMRELAVQAASDTSDVTDRSALYSRISSLETVAEALAAADSRIRDADIAEEMVRLAQTRLLARVSAAMMAQSNIMASSVLYLLSKQTAPAGSSAAGGADSAGAARAGGSADTDSAVAAPSGGASGTGAAGKRQTVREDGK